MNEVMVNEFLAKYVKSGMVVGLGSSHLSELFAKKLALKIHDENLDVSVVPGSSKLAALLHEFHVTITNLNEREVDLAIEFARQADNDFSFIKQDTLSLIRDKMIADSAAELIIIVEEDELVTKLDAWIPLEISSFSYPRTLNSLDKFGNAVIKRINGSLFKTETGNMLAEVKVDSEFDLTDFDYETKKIPGVLETGLFFEKADRIVLANNEIKVKSRMTNQ
ncbi:MAG: ribose-5-phosphate isomerase A [archaeon]